MRRNHQVIHPKLPPTCVFKKMMTWEMTLKGNSLPFFWVGSIHFGESLLFTQNPTEALNQCYRV